MKSVDDKKTRAMRRYGREDEAGQLMWERNVEHQAASGDVAFQSNPTAHQRILRGDGRGSKSTNRRSAAVGAKAAQTWAYGQNRPSSRLCAGFPYPRHHAIERFRARSNVLRGRASGDAAPAAIRRVAWASGDDMNKRRQAFPPWWGVNTRCRLSYRAAFTQAGASNHRLVPPSCSRDGFAWRDDACRLAPRHV
jgi:hypothetical protein